MRGGRIKRRLNNRCLGSIAAASALWIGLFTVSAPQPARAVTLATGITAGGAHTCVVTSEGSAKCWGWNYYGQLGVGTDTGPEICGWGSETYPIGCSTVPAAVSGLGSGVSEISSGYADACALMNAGTVKCWGYNAGGQLGNGTDTGPEGCGQFPTPCSTTPVNVSGLTGVTEIASGWNHTCAITSTGGIKCWGASGNGQIGDGTADDRSAPVDVDLPNGVTATSIAAGAEDTCALTSTGEMLCWGSNRSGQLGIGTDEGPEECEPTENACSTTPVAVQLPIGATPTEIAIGEEFACVLTSTGDIMCWGFNSDGQLGDGTEDDSSVPVAVDLPNGVTATAISAFAFHVCVVTSTGGAECWGDNASGQLGDGTTNDSSVPVAVNGLGAEVTAIAPGWDHTCALTSIGGLECWGFNRNGPLGTGDTKSSRKPMPVKGLTGARTLSVSVAGAGSGAITSMPAGINCGAGHTSCSAAFAAGSTVQLHANAEPGSAFSKFSESCTGTTCTVTMGPEQAVVATFALPPSASIATPEGGQTYMLGEAVPTKFFCSEGASGPGLISCVDSRGVKTASGGLGKLDTSTVGFHAYTVTAVSQDGLARSASVGYRVTAGSEPPGPQPEPQSPEPKPSPLNISIRSGSALIAQGRSKISLGCDGGAPTSVCRGRLTLTIRPNVKRRSRQAPSEGLIVTGPRFAIPTGKSKLLGVRLPDNALALLRRASHRSLRAKAIATLHGGPTSSRAIALRLAKD
jgi:alpha-tubulin suppressor-like RCC1 family protein